MSIIFEFKVCHAVKGVADFVFISEVVVLLTQNVLIVNY